MFFIYLFYSFLFIYVLRCAIDQLDTQTEKKRASQCENYQAGPEKKQMSQRARYRADPEKPERAAKRQRFWQSPECARLAKRVKVTQRYVITVQILVHVATYCMLLHFYVVRAFLRLHVHVCTLIYRYLLHFFCEVRCVYVLML